MYYDGRRWHYVKMMQDIYGTAVDLWKRQDGGTSLYRITIKTGTVILELDNLGGFPENVSTYEVPRTYTGPFNRLSMNMGNVLSTSQKVNYVDQIEVKQGYVERLIPLGACCVRTGLGEGTCSTASQADCEGTLGGTYLGDDSVCGTGGTNCEFCPSYFGDSDDDEDVDQADFGLLQRCLTGPGPFTLSAGCTCFDSEHDADVDSDDLAAFQACLQGSGVQAPPACQRP